MSKLLLNRTDNSIFGQWWWSIDSVLLPLSLFMLLFGLVIIITAGEPAAARIEASSNLFIFKQLKFLPIAFMTMLFISFLSARNVRRFGMILFYGMLLLTLSTLFIGAEIKGATRWISLGFISLQPSELLKPAFAVALARMYANAKQDPTFPGDKVALAMMACVVAVLVGQPDMGTTLLIIALWGVMWFLSGLAIHWVGALIMFGLTTIMIAYLTMEHFAYRVNVFLNPDKGNAYQIRTAFEAFRNGSWTGVGPGEGTVKNNLPDAHTDFIFAVVAEEFGLIACVLLLLAFATIVLRAFYLARRKQSLFAFLAISGCACLLFGQMFINLASSVGLIPTKGMTLPFISYGGSSLIGVSITMGIILALTRADVGKEA
jgi:cell division protein FtsW